MIEKVNPMHPDKIADRIVVELHCAIGDEESGGCFNEVLR